jgi:hypothetical protein
LTKPKVEASGQNSGDQLDKAGQSILRLLQKAAGVAEENSRYAMETAHKLSQQLRAAEDRIARLEAEIEEQRDKAARAEQWLRMSIWRLKTVSCGKKSNAKRYTQDGRNLSILF